MKEYFLAIAAVAFIGGIVISLSPCLNTGKYIRLLCGLCIVACIMLPLFSYIAEGEFDVENIVELFQNTDIEREKYDEIYNSALNNVEKINADKNLKAHMIKALSLKNEDFDVRLIVVGDGDEKYIDSVEVTIYASGIEIDPHSVEKYIKELLGCECVIYYDL